MYLCATCQAQRRICCQAFTAYTCEMCNKEFQHPNTCIPDLCNECAINNNRCQRCQDEVKDK